MLPPLGLPLPACSPSPAQSGYNVTPLPRSEVKELASSLPRLSQDVLLREATERPFSGQTADKSAQHNTKAKGTWISAVSNVPLFSSDAKFESGTGWPSFYAPVDEQHVTLKTDRSIPFMTRTEVLDARSGTHLGHVFDDGVAYDARPRAAARPPAACRSASIEALRLTTPSAPHQADDTALFFRSPRPQACATA